MPISGRNAKRVLFGAIDLGRARRVVLIRTRAGQADAQAFLRALRRRYRRAGWLWLLSDGRAPTPPRRPKRSPTGCAFASCGCPGRHPN